MSGIVQLGATGTIAKARLVGVQAIRNLRSSVCPSSLRMDSIPISRLCRYCVWNVPVYLFGQGRSRRRRPITSRFHHSVGRHLHGFDHGSIVDFQREYRTRMARIRLYLPSFRSWVLRAYNLTCAICRLHHLELLDATRILPDGHPRGGPLHLTELHCANSIMCLGPQLLGIHPDFVLAARTEPFREIGHPMH